MTEDEDIDGLAAEYVLGSLDAAERTEVDARRRTDRQLAEAIAAWERRLAPLSEREPGIAPPPHLIEDILARIAGEQRAAVGSAQILPLRGRAGRRWAFTLVGTALAACLALAVVWFNETGVGPQIEARMDCGTLYKQFWEQRESQMYSRITPEQLAGVSRMALRAYDACLAGDEQDAKSLFDRLDRMQF
jgi:anti-sigma factor RsiW